MKREEYAGDWLTERGAKELARRVREYWLERGRVVEVRVEPALWTQHEGIMWGVRSNIGASA